MRSTILSRSVIAVASLAVASAALTVAPATAATASGITRDQVLTAAAAVRTATEDFSPATEALLTSLVLAQCDGATADNLLGVNGTATQAGGSADGLIVEGVFAKGGTTLTGCEFGAIATTDASFALAGSAAITGKFIDTPGATDGVPKTLTASLSGDVGVTPNLISTLASFSQETTLLASGNATKTISTKVVKKIKDKKTKSQKKAAKKKYDKKLKSLKKSYKKSLDKAGSSKSKKAAAKKTYSVKKKAAKTAYTYAIANYKLVRKTVPKTENRPFSLTAVSS